MGFDSVFGTLLEVFPQVDTRLLKAAAIEHTDDPDGSVEFILTEILPYINTTKQFGASSSVTQSGQGNNKEFPGELEVENDGHCVPNFNISICVSSSMHPSTSLAGEAAYVSREMNDLRHVGPDFLNDAVYDYLDSTYNDAEDDGDHLIRNTRKAAIESGEMNGLCHVDPISLDETVDGSLHFSFGNPKEIGDQLSGSTRKTANGEGEMNIICHVEATCLNETVNSSLDSTICDAEDLCDQLSGNTRTLELTSSCGCKEAAGAIAGQDASFHNVSVSNNLEFENNGLEDTTALHADFCGDSLQWLDSVELSSLSVKDHYLESLDHPNQSEFQSSLSASNHKIPECNGFADGVFREDIEVPDTDFCGDSLQQLDSVELSSLSVKDHDLESLDHPIHSEVQSSLSASNHKIPECNGFANGAFRENIEVPDSDNIEESSSKHTGVTLSSQLCSTGLLEDIIEDAKSHKKTLFSSMESVRKLMREVELEEKIAQQAKEEAVKGGLEILAKVEELKRMLSNAREANDMHSGQVYGDRAILATEMRELQYRLILLSDEKDDSLSVLNTMRQDLEKRLTAAEAERIAAEQEKHAKKQIAQRALAEQELIMEKVVQESQILQHEAEENAKFSEFLVDRGHVVDMLQGEVSVICQDVKLLKERYDSCVPLSERLFPKQTTCILASSGSSRKSTGSEQVLEKQDIRPSLSNESFLIPSVELVSEPDQKEPVEEGWELFDDYA